MFKIKWKNWDEYSNYIIFTTNHPIHTRKTFSNYVLNLTSHQHLQFACNSKNKKYKLKFLKMILKSERFFEISIKHQQLSTSTNCIPQWPHEKIKHYRVRPNPVLVSTSTRKSLFHRRRRKITQPRWQPPCLIPKRIKMRSAVRPICQHVVLEVSSIKDLPL